MGDSLPGLHVDILGSFLDPRDPSAHAVSQYPYRIEGTKWHVCDVDCRALLFSANHCKSPWTPIISVDLEWYWPIFRLL